MSDWQQDLETKHGTPACGPITVDEGWRNLVEFAYHYISQHPCLSAAQVKEKYGGLRFYVDHHYECRHEDCPPFKAWRAIEDAIEQVSYLTCEQCGAVGELRKVGWWRTLCDDCRPSESAGSLERTHNT